MADPPTKPGASTRPPAAAESLSGLSVSGDEQPPANDAASLSASAAEPAAVARSGEPSAPVREGAPAGSQGAPPDASALAPRPEVVDLGGTSPAAKRGAAWGDPLASFEQRWVQVETKLAVAVLVAEVLSLCAWVLLKGMSTPPTANASGVVLRAAITSVVLGSAAWFGLAKQPERLRSTATTIAAAAGLFIGRAWATVGVQYSSEILNWYQDASSLTLIGGLRGVGTRLTAWLAMLGASLATSSGKHINIDVVMRFVPVRARVPAAIAAWGAAAVVCFAATWGFVDHIAIASFGAKRTDTAGHKLGVVTHELGEHFFVLRRQMGLDFVVGFRVLAGRKYTESLTGAEWNERIREGGYEAYFTADQVKGLLQPDANLAKHVAPLVIVPGKSQRGLLVEGLNLLFPFGFFMIGLKFLLRVLLALSGHVEVDPDAMHRDEGGSHGPPPDDTHAGDAAAQGAKSLWEPCSSSPCSCSRCSACRCSPSWAASRRSRGSFTATPSSTTCATWRPTCSTTGSRGRPSW